MSAGAEPSAYGSQHTELAIGSFCLQVCIESMPLRTHIALHLSSGHVVANLNASQSAQNSYI